MAFNSSFRRSVVTALLTCGFFAALFLTNMNTPGRYMMMIVSGMAVSALLTCYFFKHERRANPKSSAAGVYIVVTIVILFGLFAILPFF